MRAAPSCSGANTPAPTTAISTHNASTQPERHGGRGAALQICPNVKGQATGAMVSDGAGGAIVAWSDFVSGLSNGIFAQRIGAAGALQWGSDGVRLRTSDFLYSPIVASDGAGGAIVVWEDLRDGKHYGLYAQRVGAAGGALWTGGGVPVSTRSSQQFEEAMVADDAGGAIVAWVDAPDFNGGNRDIYVQRISAGGVALWSSYGKGLCTAVGGQEPPSIVTDGAGGAIVAWDDRRDGADVYARRVNAAGTPLWDTDGVPLGAAVGAQYWSTITSDGAGGAIATWMDGVSQCVRHLRAECESHRRAEVGDQRSRPLHGRRDARVADDHVGRWRRGHLGVDRCSRLGRRHLCSASAGQRPTRRRRTRTHTHVVLVCRCRRGCGRYQTHVVCGRGNEHPGHRLPALRG